MSEIQSCLLTHIAKTILMLLPISYLFSLLFTLRLSSRAAKINTYIITYHIYKKYCSNMFGTISTCLPELVV